jgi:hypothetical protein
MKLSNIFKKNTKTVAKANVEKLEKKQLEKVVGGLDAITSADNSAGVVDVLKTKHDTAKNSVGNIR